MNRIKELEKDIITGQIRKMKLIETSNEVVRSNRNALMFDVWREVCNYFDGKRFGLVTYCNDAQPAYEKENGAYVYRDVRPATSFHTEICEAYFGAFTYYDGKYLIAEHHSPSAVNLADRVQITKYECSK